MRLHLGAIPSSPNFVPDASWRRLREPSPGLEKLVVFPIGVAAAVTVAGLWSLLTPLPHITPAVSLPALLLSFAGMVVVQELLPTGPPGAGMLLAALVLCQVPATGIVRQQSWKTYWREPDTLTA
jgi:hypothetical protein